VVVAGTAKLAREHVRLGHREAGAFAGEERDFDVEAAVPAAGAVDQPDFAHAVALRAELRQQCHLLGDVVADAPEVDHVAAAPKLGRLLDEQDFVTGPAHPVCEGRTGDSGALDRDPHGRPGPDDPALG
jgi:hypothetical protein